MYIRIFIMLDNVRYTFCLAFYVYSAELVSTGFKNFEIWFNHILRTLSPTLICLKCSLIQLLVETLNLIIVIFYSTRFSHSSSIEVKWVNTD